jgi:hypothetical protein
VIIYIGRNEEIFLRNLKKQFLSIIFHEVIDNKYHGKKEESSKEEETSIVFAQSQKSHVILQQLSA